MIDRIQVGDTSHDIKDSSIPDYIRNLNVYSTTEQQIGTWIDGKPLYRKVITGSKFTIDVLNPIEHNIDNLGTLVNVEGSYKRADGIIGHLPREDYTPSWCVRIGDITDKVVNITPGGSFVNNFAISSLHLILTYTKTTD